MKKIIVDLLHRLGFKKLLKEEIYYDEDYEGSRKNLVRVIRDYSNYSASWDYYIGGCTVWYSYPNFHRLDSSRECWVSSLEDKLKFEKASIENSGGEFKCSTWEYNLWDKEDFWEQYKFWKKYE